MADNEEQYVLNIASVGTDQAAAQVAQLNSNLAATTTQVVALDQASLTLAQQLSLPGAAEALHLTAEELAALSTELGIAEKQTEQLGEKTSGLIGNWLRGKDEADGFLLELEKIQASESASNPTGLLGMGDTGVAIGFMNELAIIQEQEAQAQAQITEQMALQGDLAQRLAESALARESAETGFVAQLREEAFATPQGGGAGDDGSGGGIGVGGLRSGLRAGGFLLGADAGGGTLRAAGQIATLTSVLGPFGVVAGIAAVALREGAEAEQKRTEAVKEYIAEVGNASGKTSEQIQQQIDQEQLLLNTYKTAQTTLQGFADQADELSRRQNLLPGQEGRISQDEYLAALDTLDQQVSQATGGLVTDAYSLTDALKEGQAQIDKTQGSVNFLGIAIKSVDTAAADAAEALHKAALVQEADADKALSIDRLTKEQRDERTAQDERDINVLTRLVGAGNLNSEALTNVKERIDTLNADLKALDATSETYADQLKREADAKQALIDADDKTLDLLASEGDIRDKIASTEADIQQARSDAADKSREIWSDEAAKIADIQEQGGEKRAEIETNTQANIAKIMRDSGQDLYNDVASRDALKYALDSQKQQTQLADQQTNEKKQLDAEAATEAKSIAQAQSAAAKAELNLEQSLGKELAAKDRALLQEQTDLQNVLAGELALSQQYGVGIVSSAEYTWQGIQSVFNEVGNGIVYNLRAAAYGGASVPIPYSQFTAPGFTPAPLPAVSGTAAGGRNVTVNVHGMGLTLGQTLNHVLGMIDTLYD